MPRPTKCRRICRVPENLEFVPTGEPVGDAVVLHMDEFEAVRLIDREGLSQEECGAQLGVGRTTAQKIYETARKKLADALVLGLSLRIEGGDFALCNGDASGCYQRECSKRRSQRRYDIKKGDAMMRIAVTYENGDIFQHFGHTEQFKVYDVEDGRIVDSRVIGTDGQGHGALADVLNGLQADVLICGGIGGGAQMALASIGIQLCGGVSGDADAAVNAFLANRLRYNPDVKCNHHDHGHGEGHTCGSHGCGKGSYENHGM